MTEDEPSENIDEKTEALFAKMNSKGKVMQELASVIHRMRDIGLSPAEAADILRDAANEVDSRDWPDGSTKQS